MKVKSITHVALVVSNLEKAVSFYWENFAFPLVFADEMSQETMHKLYGLSDVSIRYGVIRGPKGVSIEIFEYDPYLPAEKFNWQRIGMQHFALEVNNVKKWHQKLKNKCEIITAPEKNAGADLLYLKDCDGNVIELIDTKSKYHLNRWLGGIAGRIMRLGKFKKYYKQI